MACDAAMLQLGLACLRQILGFKFYVIGLPIEFQANVALTVTSESL